MKIMKVTDPAFAAYGKILEGFDTAQLLQAMREIPMPESGTAYEPGIASLEACSIFQAFSDRAYGGMPVQVGMCWGYNTKLNCLEYHRDSEVNIGTEDFVLLLAKQDDIVDGKLDTGKVQAFFVPAGVAVEVYATSLHYAPCHTDAQKGFRVAVDLPKFTNTDKPAFTPKSQEDTWLTARNKWLLAHAESSEAQNGAYVGLTGENIDISNDL